jgi:hypothetical protein
MHKLRTVKDEIQGIPDWQLYARTVFFNESNHPQKRVNGSITRTKQTATRATLSSTAHGTRVTLNEK